MWAHTGLSRADGVRLEWGRAMNSQKWTMPPFSTIVASQTIRFLEGRVRGKDRQTKGWGKRNVFQSLWRNKIFVNGSDGLVARGEMR